MYQHILVATDLSKNCLQIIATAIKLANQMRAKISLVHVIEPVPMAFGADVPLDVNLVKEQQLAQAQELLANLVLANFGQFSAGNTHIIFGQTQAQIQQLAADQNCDLIVVGNKCRHGLAILLGSTTNDLLSKAPCDVLTIRLTDA